MKTKNLLKATVATLVAGAMGLAGVGSAMAADARVDASKLGAAARQTLTVTANGDISNRTLKAVPLAYYSYAQTDGTNITGFDLIDAGKASAIADALTKANIDTKSKKDQTAGYDYNASNPMVWVVQNLLDSENSPWAGKLRDFLDQLKNETAVTGDKGTAFAKGADAQHMTASVRPGVYAVVDTTVKGEASIVMFNGTGIDGKTMLKNGAKTYTLGTVNYKVHSTTVTKKITAAENGTVENSGATAETAIGKKVSFEMTSKVPNWTGYDKYYYAINDTYSKGLTYDAAKDNMVVTVDGKTLIRDTDYKVTTEDGKFHIIFAPTTGDSTTASDIVAMKAKFPVDAAVKVTYDMYVNKNAVSGTADTNTNNVEYSHNPNTVTDHKTTPGQTDKVYVGKFTLTKHDTNNAPLAGAEFKVYEGNQTATPVKFIKVNDNTYRKADLTESTGTTDTVTSVATSNGVLTLTGLDGKYTVKETKSPFNGSILPQFTLTIKVNQSNGSYTLSQFDKDANNLASENADHLGVTVINARNIADMPKTGAVWLSIFGVMTVLLAGASALLLRRKA
ncbi:MULTISPECIES: isopeptide-forming domain-containing fimbrial protein [Bifidobacterium]|uniref:isopeptide-forming domain-containing fimbrial protein n=1 Tax=Bifidobacterium TaxID=1678 RepID=UPI001C386958|nr:isopeptide-forming domain-containing fimbrial protein [Bifidobacterium adolescentis]MBV3836109.1 isopeptide-forming domain-containing fimbrial protein [Bifidobacterium sp. MSK.17.10]MCG4567279.1 isopeptide-forming domain-containing fimbrial protein [Bifidobacterium adolescentis]